MDAEWPNPTDAAVGPTGAGSFRLNGRTIEWRVVPHRRPVRRLIVRSQTGGLHVEADVHDHEGAHDRGGPSATIGRPRVSGPEFPLGQWNGNCLPEFRFGVYEAVKHGVIHSDLVRSLLERWMHGRRYKHEFKPAK